MPRKLFLYYWACFNKKRLFLAGRAWSVDADALCGRMRRIGLLPVEVRYSRLMYLYPAWWWKKWAQSQAREELGLSLVAFFCRHVEALMGGGLSFFAALQVCATTANDSRLRAAVGDVVTYISCGLSPGEAFLAQEARWPAVVPLVFSAAQGTGAFREVLVQVAEAFEREISYRRDIARAALLPIVTGLITLCVFGWAFYMCAEQGIIAIDLQWLAGASFCVMSYGVYVAPVLVGVCYVCFSLLRSVPKVRFLFGWAVLKMPFVGGIAARAQGVLFFTMLALLLKARVPVLEALRAIQPLFANEYWKNAIDDMCVRVEGGASLAGAMEEAPRMCIPALFVTTLFSATSALLAAVVCRNMAAVLMYERARLMERYASLLQPALMALVGAVIVGCLYALYQNFSSSIGDLRLL